MNGAMNDFSNSTVEEMEKVKQELSQITSVTQEVVNEIDSDVQKVCTQIEKDMAKVIESVDSVGESVTKNGEVIVEMTETGAISSRTEEHVRLDTRSEPEEKDELFVIDPIPSSSVQENSETSDGSELEGEIPFTSTSLPATSKLLTSANNLDEVLLETEMNEMKES